MSGCSFSEKNGGSHYGYLETAFRTEIRGSLGSVSFCATVGYNGEREEICYLLPDALAGYRLEKSGDGTHLYVDGECFDVSEEALAGLLAPLNVLLTEREILRIQKNGDGIALTQEDGGILQLNGKGIPTEYASSALSFAVVWWETVGKSP